LRRRCGVGQEVVVLDNLSSHKGERVRQMFEESGCEVLYLPPYSPDYKWDEKAKIILR
jgi:transposase